MKTRRRAGQVEGRPGLDSPVKATCEVLDRRREGAYWLLSVAAPQIAQRARPGQFVQIAVDARDTLLRRPFSIARVSRRGAVAGTVEVIFDAHGPGTDWLTRVGLHDVIDVIGPLGTAFPLPQRKVSCLLVGGGYGAAPLFSLAQELVDRQLRVDMIIGASTVERILSPIEAKSVSVTTTFTTDDGTYGHPGQVTDVMPEVMETASTGVVYACGPNPMLAAVSRVATERGVPVQVAIEERMACGFGVCFTCVVPVHAKDGAIRMKRSCVDGPVFNGARIAWDQTRYAASSADDGSEDESAPGSALAQGADQGPDDATPAVSDEGSQDERRPRSLFPHEGGRS